MTTKTVTIQRDGSLIVTKTDDTPPVPPGSETAMPIVMHRDHGGFEPGSFVAGMVVAAMIAIALTILRRRRLHRPVDLGRARDEDRMANEVAALARRTATLETIVTDPAQRTAREIDALR